MAKTLNIEARTDIKAEAKLDTKQEVKDKSKLESVVQGKFAEIPHNDEL